LTDPAAIGEAVLHGTVETAKNWYWLATNPIFWVLIVVSIWNGGRIEKTLKAKDIARWAEENRRNESKKV
jgi:hypothetical protein